MKLVWLSSFPLHEITINNLFTQVPKAHPSTWVYNLALELSKYQENIDLNIITLSPHVHRDTKVKWNGINVWILKVGVPFLNKGFPFYFRFDIFTHYKFEERKLFRKVKELDPDLIHIHGSEYAYIKLFAKFRTKSLLSIQGICSEIFKNSIRLSDKVQSRLEISAVKRGRYFGVRTHYDSRFVKKVNRQAIIFKLNEAVSPIFFEKNWVLFDTVSFIYVGSIIPRKGIHVLISALVEVNKIYPEFKLNLIGGIDKKYKSELSLIIHKSNLQEKIFFLGQHDSKFISEQLACSTIFVLPSFFENSPNSLAEAMVVGTPAVASDVGGVSSMIEDGKNGLLFKAGDKGDLANKIIWLLNNKKSMVEISEKARSTARIKHNPPNVAQEAISAYHKILEG